MRPLSDEEKVELRNLVVGVRDDTAFFLTDETGIIVDPPGKRPSVTPVPLDRDIELSTLYSLHPVKLSTRTVHAVYIPQWNRCAVNLSLSA